MDPSKYSTRNPIFLVLREFKPVVIDTILSYKLSLVQAGTTLTLSINDQETDVPNQCYDALKLLLHHIRIYQRTCIALRGLQNSPSNVRATYISITYYYCEVLFAFCKEVQDDVPVSDETWRSAHLDYHFAMAFNDDAFDHKMQIAKLKRIKRTWSDFKNKKVYVPVKTLSVVSYHKSYCKGQDMCGDTTANHTVSVLDMIENIVGPYRSSAAVGTSVKVEKAVRFTSDVEEQREQDAPSKKSNVKIKIAPIASATSSGTASNSEEDDIEMAVNMFLVKEDGKKPSKSRKGGRKRKDIGGSATTNASDTIVPDGKKRAPRAVSAKGKSKAIVESEDEDVATNTTTYSAPHIYDVGEETEAIAIVENVNVSEIAEGQSASYPETTNKIHDERSQPQASQPLLTVQKADRVQDTHDVKMRSASETAEYAGQYDDVQLPTALEEWQDWNRIAFEKGNSRIFLKLGTWILLRLRQLENRPIDGDVDGMLIPESPGLLEIDNDANFHEALGMDRLYSALVHMDTHPQYLAHIFHEVGKASSEERLGCSHPSFRPLPDLPTPIQSMISHDEFSWLQVLPHDDEDTHPDDIDAEGDIDDDQVDDEDGDVAGALNDMEISESPDLPDASEQQKRKRAMSSTFSPPKISEPVPPNFQQKDGGRGHPKRPKSGQAELFNRPSSPIVRSIGEAAIPTSWVRDTRTIVPYQMVTRTGSSHPITSSLHNTHAHVPDGGSSSKTHPHVTKEGPRQHRISDSGEDAVMSTDDPDHALSASDRLSNADSDKTRPDPSRMPSHRLTDVLIMESHMRSQSLTDGASQEDEDVRILVASTPE